MRFSSGERRGTILLLVIVALVVVLMALWRGYTKSEIEQLPMVSVDSVADETTEFSKPEKKVRGKRSLPADSLSDEPKSVSRKHRRNAMPKKTSSAGRQRDFLNEPVR